MSQDSPAPNYLAFIIEDDARLASICSITLEQANYETEIIQDGQIAIQRLAAVIPDVVILDLHLPSVSGADILKQIRADQRLTRTRVIIITADLFRAETLRPQADAVLIKPVSPIRLQGLITKLRTSPTAKPNK